MGRARTKAEHCLNRAVAGMRADARKRAREAMTPADVEVRMREVVEAKLERDGKDAIVSLDDFQQANLPMEKVRPIAARIVKEVSASWGRK